MLTRISAPIASERMGSTGSHPVKWMTTPATSATNELARSAVTCSSAARAPKSGSPRPSSTMQITLTVMPISRPKVNRLLTRGLPNSVCAAKCASRCSGCTFIVRELNSTLSISVRVRVQACSNACPGENCS